MLSRRQLLKLAALAGVSMALPLKWLAKPTPTQAFSQSDGLTKFIQPLRRVGTDIPVAKPDKVKQPWWQPGVTHYTIDIGPFEDKLHPELPHPTRLWGFGQKYSASDPGWTKHLGGVIAAKRGEPVQITFRNHLPADHILPVDTTIMGADGAASRADIHLHGGFVPWISDGGPHAWWDVDGSHGESFINNQVLRPGQATAPNEAEYYYPNDQSARLMWYHDHTFGNTRINAYAGMATGYVIYDDYEVSLVTNHNLPGPLDARTVYMVFQDKIFVSSLTATADPTWSKEVKHTRQGDLWYAHEYDPTRWDETPPGGVLPNPSIIPEFFGDTMLVNGTVFPYMEVEPRQYRFRLLNACNARFLNLSLVYTQEGHLTEPDISQPGPSFLQFGTEGGFMPAPVELNGADKLPLLMAPAERVDMIVDFREVDPGSTLILYNDAPAPYPMGDDLNDYYPGNPLTPNARLGKGPNTRTIMQFRVKPLSGPADAVISLPAQLTPTDPFLVEQVAGEPTDIPDGVKTRYVTLNENNDELGRLIQKLGTPEATAPGFFGRAYEDKPTEVVSAGSTEVWEILNLTGDVHPIHFHLVNVQILSRQLFDADHYAGGEPTYTADATGPDAFELGWKETVHVNPGEVTRVLMKFSLPNTPFKVPESPRTGGLEYVWHCHILEHEEHDMMRPLIVEENKVYLPSIIS